MLFGRITPMQEIKLHAQKRDITGRKVKRLRKEGLVPANVYGKKTKSVSIFLKREEFEEIYKEAGETSVVKLLIEGEKEERPILIVNLQVNPVTEEPLHADLRQIVLTEKVTARIPIELEGEAPVVEQKLGILIQTVSEIEVEALPMDLPEKFVVDVSEMAKVGDEIKTKDLKVDKKKIELKIGEDLVLAKIEPLAAEEVAPPPPTEEAVPGKEVPAEGGEKPKEENIPSEEKTETSQEKKEEK